MSATTACTLSESGLDLRLPRHRYSAKAISASIPNLCAASRVEGEEFHGQFTSEEDSGPVDLNRTGEPHQPSSMEHSLHLTPQQWQEDVDVLARELPKRHVNAFHHLTRTQFDAGIADLKHVAKRALCRQVKRSTEFDESGRPSMDCVD